MLKKILANDGIDTQGKLLLEQAGFTVITDKVEQANLAHALQTEKYVGITVRSATQVRKELLDACPDLKFVARGGVGMDNIDVDYAKAKGLAVINTPAASSYSVAELVFSHLFSMVRFLHQSNREMPVLGNSQFNQLKKEYSKGIELRGKTIGIIGFGRIGQAVAKYALGLGMKVKASDAHLTSAIVDLDIDGLNQPVSVKIQTCSLDELIASSDFITLHVPGGEVLTAREFAKMKKGVMLVNTSRGGVINENDLLDALNNNHVAHAALDVFTSEPQPRAELLQHKRISLSPHIGAATEEAQARIGIELAEKIIAYMDEK